MKGKFLIFGITALGLATGAQSQVSIGNNGLYISGGATVYIDRLQLQPDGDVTIQNNVLQVDHTPVTGQPKSSIARVYQWESPVTTNGLMGIYIPTTELNGNNFNLLELVYSPTGGGDDWVIHGSSAIPPEFIFATFPTTTWKKLSALEVTSVVPLRLLSFTGRQQGRTTALYWRVTDQQSVKGYTVLRSNDGYEFKPIGKLPTVCSGCAGQTNYDYSDVQPLNGYNYYQLLIINEDGHISYSDIISILFDDNQNIAINPNPVKHQFKISGFNPDEQYRLQITTGDGKIVLTSAISIGTIFYDVDASHWASGIYFIHLAGKGGIRWNGRVMKE